MQVSVGRAQLTTAACAASCKWKDLKAYSILGKGEQYMCLNGDNTAPYVNGSGCYSGSLCKFPHVEGSNLG